MKRLFLLVFAILLLLVCVACLFGCSKEPSSAGDETTIGSNQTTALPDAGDTDDIGTRDTDENKPMEVPSSVDVWDGRSSSSFSSGNGTFADPYCIATCAELAYFANRVKSGDSFEGKYLWLESDLDLNANEWLPIGTHDTPFMGNFNGNGHTVSNLKITSALEHFTSNMDYAYAGLFARCCNANINDLNLKGVTVDISSSNRYDRLYVGGLVGYIDCSSSDGTPATSSIKNVKLSDVKITVSQKLATICAGGCVGFVNVKQHSFFEADAIQSYTELICNDNDDYNYLGGIIGKVQCVNIAELSNFACYASIMWPRQAGRNYAAAIGMISSNRSNVELRNIFSKVEQTRDSASYCYAAAVVARYPYLSSSDDPDAPHGTYRFRNLFGTVVKYVPSYILPGSQEYEALYSGIWPLGIDAQNAQVINCKMCEELPADHGFSEEIWDLSSLSEPTLR